jgi:hypothetical protein
MRETHCCFSIRRPAGSWRTCMALALGLVDVEVAALDEG